jgi:hypothetical protein
MGTFIMMVEAVGIVSVPGYSAVLGIELVEPERWGVLGRQISVLICAVFGMSVAVMTNAWVSARIGKDHEFFMFESVR